MVSTVKPNSNVVDADAPEWEVIYFDAPNRGEQLRLLLHAAEIQFKDTRPTHPMKGKEFFAAMKRVSRVHRTMVKPPELPCCLGAAWLTIHSCRAGSTPRRYSIII